MRYVKRGEDGCTVEYRGCSLGFAAMRQSHWTPYAGVLPPERLRVDETGGVTELPETPPVPPPVRYSKLALIRALGDKWAQVRAELEAAGLLDRFFAADYIASDDPDFAAALARMRSTIPECDALLASCIDPEA